MLIDWNMHLVFITVNFIKLEHFSFKYITMPAEEKRLEIFFRTTVTRRCMFSFITDRRPSLQRITMAMIIPHKMRNTEI